MSLASPGRYGQRTNDRRPTTIIGNASIHRQTSGHPLCYNHFFFNDLEGLLYRHLERRQAQKSTIFCTAPTA